jgi:YD repeat-containing protein
MKWKTLEPKIGDEKTEVRFAFFPIYTDNGYTLWLERYKVHLRYETQSVATKGGYILPRTRWFVVSTEIYTRQKYAGISTTRHVDSSNTNREYDTNGKLIYSRDSDGYEVWREYDANGKVIHYRNSFGYEVWREYDDNGKLIHYRNSFGYEEWYEYDTNGKLINTRTSSGREE